MKVKSTITKKGEIYMGGHLSNKDIQYIPFVLNDIGVIELLISYRSKYDDNLFLSQGIGTFGVVGAHRINEEVITTYVALDELIEQCKFNEVQLRIIELVQFGYENGEIGIAILNEYPGEFTNKEKDNEVKNLDETETLEARLVKKRLNTIYKKIKKENDQQWRKVNYINRLELKTKNCTKCKEELPATDEFYAFDNTNNRYKSSCKKCR